jgi:putative glycosyltransferase
MPGSPHEAGKADVQQTIGLISIVTSVYRSAETIEAFIDRSLAVAAPFADRVELIVVDDGSPDRSAEIVRDIVDRDERVVLVQLSRNFGHHLALLTGLERARGDLVFLIDSDLEEEPEHLASLLPLMRATGADVVYGVQQQRKGRWIERFTGKLFYDVFNALTEVRMPLNVSTMRLMSGRYVRSLTLFRDRNPVLVPLMLVAGYRQVEYKFVKKSTSATTYSLSRRLSLLVLAVTSFTAKPLALMFWLSLLMSTGAFVVGLAVVLRALFGPVQDGWSSLMAAIVFFFSLNALFTGILGLYLKLVFDEVKDRPRTVVREVYAKAGRPALGVGSEDNVPARLTSS